MVKVVVVMYDNIELERNSSCSERYHFEFWFTR